MISLKGKKGLVADFGGTNCRFAIAGAGEPALSFPQSLHNSQFESPLAAIRSYLDAHAGLGALDWAVVAAAGPVEDNAVDLTNLAWRIDGREIAREFAIPRVRLCNDLAAIAASTPSLKSEELAPIGARHEPTPGLPTAVVGSGTGLGVSGLVPSRSELALLNTEGGHATFAPTDDLQREIVKVLEPRWGRVSNERVISGEGLLNVYQALCRIAGAAPVAETPHAVTDGARDRRDPVCIRAIYVFSRALGAFSGDVVLILGAYGGLYLAGGMLKGMHDVFDYEAFRAGFEDKGRFRERLAATPSWHIRHPYPALLGAAMLVEFDEPETIRRVSSR
jgi:glucokinase